MGARLLEIIKGIPQDARDWCVGRMWQPRLLLWFYFVWIWYAMIMKPTYWTLFHSLNLPIHEAGHLLFRAFGMTMMVAGGTILQLIAPLASTIMFLKQRDYFAVTTVCCGWICTNLYHIGVYMDDTKKRELPLVTVGGGGDQAIGHDWDYLFRHFNLWNYPETIGWMTMRLGDLTMLIGLTIGAWLMWRMFSSPPPEPYKYVPPEKKTPIPQMAPEPPKIPKEQSAEPPPLPAPEKPKNPFKF